MYLKPMTMIGFALLVALGGCKKEEETPETVLTEDDAAEVVASALGTGTNGLNSSTQQASEKTTYVASNVSNPCLYSLDTTFTATNQPGSTNTYSYSMTCGYQMYCTSGALTSMVYHLSSSGNFSTVRLSGSSSASGEVTLTGLENSAANYSISGNYDRNGSATSKVGNNNTYTYTLALDVNGLLIKKSDYTIQGGNGTATVTLANSNGTNFTFTGQLTYVNSDTATLVINGKTFTINIPNARVQ